LPCNSGKVRYDAVLFDFDGVLLDSEPVHYACWIEVLKPLNIQMDWSTFSKYCIGIPDRDAVEFLCRNNNPPVDFEAAWAYYDKKRALFRKTILDNPPLEPEVIDFIKRLDGFRLGVVSSSSREEVAPVLEKAGIADRFQVLVCREDVSRLKPDPEPYQKAARSLGAVNPLVIEDSDAGEAGGRAAGFDVVRVSHPTEVPAKVWARLQNVR